MVKRFLNHAAVMAFLGLQAVVAQASPSELIAHLAEELEDIRETISGRESAPLDPGILQRSRDDFQDTINETLDEALALVAPDAHARWSEKLLELEIAQDKALEGRGKLMLDRLVASPSKGPSRVDQLLGLEYERGSLEHVDQLLSEIEEEIVNLEVARDAAIQAFSNEMADRHGIILSMPQARALLYSVNGELMIEASVIIGVLIDVEKRLGTVMQENIGAGAMRTYAGIASLTRLLYARMLERHLAAYDGEWLPKLQEIRDSNLALMRKTERSVSQTTDESALRDLRNNIELQKRILIVADRYKMMLQDRRSITAAELSTAVQRADAAVNTLMTLENAAALSSMMIEADRDFGAIMSVEMPELERLNPEEFEEFLDISRQLGS